MVQPEFGRRLRQARLQAGLSQLELAGDAYTNSYVSYLESGRRAPTQEVADYLAERLGTTPAALGYGSGETSDLDTRIAHELLLGDKALSLQEWSRALAAADRASALAERSPRGDRRWESMHLRCRTLAESGDFETAAALAERLAEDPVAAVSPLLCAEALTLGARSLRGCGRLAAAATAAQRALDAPGIDATLEIEGLLQLIAARVELGEAPSALAPQVERLGTLAAELEPGQTRGRVLWTLGNLSYLDGDAQAGAAAHLEAADMIVAQVDLALFGRLHRVIAQYRMRNGDLRGVAKELAVARQASELVGREADLVELTVDEARYHHLEGRHEVALGLVDQALSSTEMAIPFAGRADARQLRGDVLVALGRYQLAGAAYGQAAEDYEAMDAAPRAALARTLAAQIEQRAGAAQAT